MFELDPISIRLICAFIVGFLITNSGSLIQALTQNQLASPATLGFQAIVVLIVLLVNSFYKGLNELLNIGELEYWVLVIGGILAILISFLMRKKTEVKIYKNNTNSEIDKILLIGLGINLLIGAIFAIWHFIAMALNKEFPTQIWFGHFKYSDNQILVVLMTLFLIISLVQFYIVKKLQLLSLGDSFFTSLGHDLVNLQKKVVLIVFLQTLIVVSLFGVFSFSALIIPLVLKQFLYFSKSLYHEIIYGGLCGGVFFLLFDMLCYHFTFMGAELPLGMITSTIGAIVMVSLLVRQKMVGR